MIYSADSKNINKAASLINTGEIVAFPTETVYGLGADAFNEKAVEKIFKTKGRPEYNPLIVHIKSIEDLLLVADLSDQRLREATQKMASSFWPGPLSLVLPKTERVPLIVTAGHSSVAVRLPSHPVALKLLELCDNPIAAPSANRFSRTSPTRASHVYDEFKERVPFILDAGSSAVGVESTVLSLLNEVPVLLRPGSITIESLEQVLQRKINLSSGQEKEILSPGMLEVHYAPLTRLEFYTKISKEEKLPSRTGVISFSSNHLQNDARKFTVQLVLSAQGDLNEVAQGLFSALRELDQRDLDLILVDSCQENGIGAAIMDRLKRAAKNRSEL